MVSTSGPSKSSVRAFFAGGDSHCLEPSSVPFTLDEHNLTGTDASSSSARSMTTGGAAEDLVRSSGDALDSFNKGELRGYGGSAPFLRCRYRGCSQVV